MKNGSGDLKSSLSPTLSQTLSASYSDFKAGAGVKVSALPTSDVSSLPQSFWLAASQKVSRFKTACHAAFSASDASRPKITVVATDEPTGTVLKSVSKGGDMESLVLTTAFDAGGAQVVLKPGWDFGSRSPCLQAGVGVGSGLAFGADVDADDATLEVTYPLSDADAVKPSYAVKSRRLRVALTRELEGGAIGATFDREGVDVRWNDGEWLCDVSLPYDGGRSEVKMSRGVKW